MISRQETVKLSPYMDLYEVIIPKDNMLRQINELVDFSFILEELQSKYSLDHGRKAIPPIRMFKYLLLKSIHDLSDVDLVERSKYDMSFKYFLDMSPEEEVIDPSSLTKFRRLRLQDMKLLDLLINKTVEIALEKGIIQSKILIVDATHSQACFNQKSPKEFLSAKSKSLRKAVYELDKEMVGKFPEKPTSNEVADELDYCQQVMETVESQSKVADLPAVKEKVNRLKEAIEDYDGKWSYSNDPDARVGHKSADSAFFGYKTHLAMNDERIITAAVITTGEKSDGHYLEQLVDKSQEAGMEIDTVIGDTAYSGKGNLQYAQLKEIQLISKLNPVITNGRNQRKTTFDFNKDAGMFVCPAGHMATHKKRTGEKKRNQRLTFYFDVDKCKVCPMSKGCYREGAQSKTYSLTIKSDIHEEQAAFQETEAFKELAKKRYKIEAKNSELKNPHGLKKARSAGLLGMEVQGATTIFAVNLKRIVKLLNEKE
ncbi:transposase IS4 [Alkalihalobacillus alcalophilus ATCC 27647 = CGMCC 1.3604]|uniref:Transposase n=1 Tax=Alkalihalobacillus alcalophilus ATCC 27647 = CGMCC 1.3604 TaxID=1218173 RepID=A0A094WGV1_ALKAL|nr:IS1182 family transposase [Alkalihalobacillus alcalophilus]KGA96994.1 transposase [Alkalihalobacillus alcalophilus ATCC 27647 = CGMCC 1.3604]MED1564205.1 IS1182 family transposase [Alkalihalobacillus alcalophilus]THG90274.1 transposase IS4 [Alkalihalobacillus alcalophilus ATCC 27647 = CGMCC 1.3604]